MAGRAGPRATRSSSPSPGCAAGLGVYPPLYRSTDAAGNVEPIRNCDILVDVRRPLTTDDAPLAPSSGDVTVHLTAADQAGLSGVAATWWSLDGGTWQQGTSVPVSGAGLHWIAYYSVDNAGNAEYVKWCSVTLLAGGPAKRATR